MMNDNIRTIFFTGRIKKILPYSTVTVPYGSYNITLKILLVLVLYCVGENTELVKDA